MNTRLATLAQQLSRLAAPLEAATERLVDDNRHFFEDANTEQLSRGLDAQGEPITPEYAPLTVTIKQLKGQPTDRVTLRDEGDFYSGIVARLTGNRSFEMTGTDSKTAGLEQKYGEAILGVPDPAIEEFRADYVKPELQSETRRILGL